MITINEYLDWILSDFEEYLRSNPHLCQLKDVHYDGGRVPDYSDIHIQQLYLLRYAYAYAFEYKVMYKHLPKYMHNRAKLSITSLGCGNMIDYWAIAQVVGSQTALLYKGYDSIDWSYKFSARNGDSVLFTLGDAILAIEDLAFLSSDIIIFPKSISEFSHDAIDRFCECIRSKTILKDRICILISLRADQGSTLRDVQKTKKIYDAFLDAGFSTDSRHDVATHLSFPDRKIREIDVSFEHPGAVVNLLPKLNTQCAEYMENGQNCYKNCVSRLSRWPMLSCKHMQWQMFEFERKVVF